MYQNPKFTFLFVINSCILEKKEFYFNYILIELLPILKYIQEECPTPFSIQETLFKISILASLSIVYDVSKVCYEDVYNDNNHRLNFYT